MDSVQTTDSAQTVFLSNRGTMTLPVELELRFEGGRTERVKLPVEMWNLGPQFKYRVRAPQRITSVEIDPRRVLPDIDRSNNTRQR